MYGTERQPTLQSCPIREALLSELDPQPDAQESTVTKSDPNGAPQHAAHTDLPTQHGAEGNRTGHNGTETEWRGSGREGAEGSGTEGNGTEKSAQPYNVELLQQ
ncbi:hypothetical protein GN956_G12548 [Arapaima gigas]